MGSDGGGFATIRHFSNTNGIGPLAGMVAAGETFFGTTRIGGGYGAEGTIYRTKMDGSDFTTLISFPKSSGTGTNSTGVNCEASLILSGHTLYGTARYGGAAGNGTVFKVNTNGTSFQVLHHFSVASGPSYTNSDGAQPDGSLVLLGDALYGTALYGGRFGNGVVYAVNKDGTGFTNLHDFTALSGTASTNWDGANPMCSLTFSDGFLYGTTMAGGQSGSGTVFNISLAPALLVTRAGENLVVTWPTNVMGFTLQATPEIGGVFTNVSGATSPLTNPIIRSQQFFRLISN